MTRPRQLPSNLVFNNLEKIREFLKLTVDDILPLLGVSRPTYYSWKGNKTLNRRSTNNVTEAMRRLLLVGRHPKWQKWTQIHLTGAKRREILNDVLASLPAPADPPE